jgi:hypothetical protein
MRDYGKVHTSFWSSATIRAMSEDGRALAMYLLTSPHGTIAGVMRLPDGYVCEDLQWPSERVSEGFAELFRNGFANRCETTKWVWIRKHFEWNAPENPNQRKSARKIVVSIPDECDWKVRFISVCGQFVGIENPNPYETVPEPFLNQEQEQEQKKEKEDSCRKPPSGRISYPAEFLELWAVYPTDKIMSKKDAFVAWQKLDDQDRQTALAFVPAFKAYCKANPNYRPVHLVRYITSRRFDNGSDDTIAMAAANDRNRDANGDLTNDFLFGSG